MPLNTISLLIAGENSNRYAESSVYVECCWFSFEILSIITLAQCKIRLKHSMRRLKSRCKVVEKSALNHSIKKESLPLVSAFIFWLMKEALKRSACWSHIVQPILVWKEKSFR